MFFKMSEEISKDFSTLMATSIMQKTLESLKDASDTGTFKFVISTDDEDRQGEKVNQAGLDFGMYMKNPVVLWGHKYDQPPVGVTTRIYKEGGKTLAEGKWASTAFAQELRKLYDEGIINACSIGYIPKELDEDGNTQKGEVLEYSIVSIPANPYALSQRMVQEKKIDLNMLVSKGFDFKFEGEIKHTEPVVKSDAVAGDSCQMDDGTAGTMSDDGNGSLICQPIKDAGVAEKPKAQDTAEDDTGDEPGSKTALAALRDALDMEIPKHKSYTSDATEEFKTFAKGNSEDGDGKKAAASKMSDKVGSENGRHEKEVMAGVEQFCKDIQDFHTAEKAGVKPAIPDGVAKAIAKFNKDVKGEIGDSNSECLKCVQEYGNKAMEENSADKIDNIHQKCTKSLATLHEGHTSNINTHIEKCMKAIDKSTDAEKAAVAAKEKTGVQEELEQTDEWKAKYSKLDRVYDIFYAFTSAYMDESSAVDDFEKLLDEAVSLMKSEGTQAKGLLEKHFVAKAGRALSKQNLETLKSSLSELEKAMTAHDTAQDSMGEVHKSHKTVLTALKGLISGPNDGGDGDTGGDSKTAIVADAKTEPAPEIKVDKTSEVIADEKALEAFLLNRELLKNLVKGINGALEKWNETHGKQRPADSRK